MVSSDDESILGLSVEGSDDGSILGLAIVSP